MNSSRTDQPLESVRDALHLERPTLHASLNRGGEHKLAADDFRIAAADFLENHASTLIDNIDNLVDLPGRWHPAGYAVFTLGHHAEFGTLRFHVWPAGLRRPEARPRGRRDIHDHVLHISSIVLAGMYSDSFYEVIEFAGDPEDPAALHVYSPADLESGSQGLAPTGEVVRAAESERRSVGLGSVHFIPEGPFHVPTIPVDQTAATVSFSSPPARDGGPRVLFESNVGRVAGARTAISTDDRVWIRRHLTSVA